jgi:hypothetical protein
LRAGGNRARQQDRRPGLAWASPARREPKRARSQMPRTQLPTAACQSSPRRRPGMCFRTPQTIPRGVPPAPLGGPAARRNGPRRGFRISDGFISPPGLVAIGLLPGRCCGRVRGCGG